MPRGDRSDRQDRYRVGLALDWGVAEAVVAGELGRTRIVLGLGCALALLAACGSSRTNASSTGGSGEDGVGDGNASEGGEESAGETEGMVEPVCTYENYEDHPDLAAVWDVVCVPTLSDGTCAVCDLACAEELLPCQNSGGGTLLGPPDVITGDCYGYAVLCSEQLGDECCHFITANQSIAIPGRPLRVAGAPLLPQLCVDGEPSEVGSRYRQLARYEQASVAAFEEAAERLAAMGAPTDLVDSHRDAAREEARHARLALAAAESVDGVRASLVERPTPLADADLRDFAIDLVRDGCLGELMAAAEALDELERADVREQPALLRFWSTVAVDEAGHAALAWEVLEWLLAREPTLEPVVRAELRRGAAAGQVPIALVEQARTVVAGAA